MQRRLFVGIVSFLLAVISIVGVISGKHQRDAGKAFDIRIAELKSENERISASNAAFRAQIEELRFRLEIIKSSRRGECHPEITRMIEDAWNASHRIVPLKTLKSMVWVESRCLPWATSNRDALGLLQVKQQAAYDLGYEHLAMLDPEIGLSVGLEHLEGLVRKSEGNIAESLARYHWGSYRYDNGVTTGEYSRKVMQ